MKLTFLTFIWYKFVQWSETWRVFCNFWQTILSTPVPFPPRYPKTVLNNWTMAKCIKIFPRWLFNALFFNETHQRKCATCPITKCIFRTFKYGRSYKSLDFFSKKNSTLATKVQFLHISLWSCSKEPKEHWHTFLKNEEFSQEVTRSFYDRRQLQSKKFCIAHGEEIFYCPNCSELNCCLDSEWA